MSDGAVCLFALYSLQSSRRFTETVNNIISRDYYCHLSCFIHAGNLRWLIKIDEMFCLKFAHTSTIVFTALMTCF